MISRYLKTAVGVLALGFVAFAASSGVLKSSGAHPGSTGAPGESTCRSCHQNAVLVPDASPWATLEIRSGDTIFTEHDFYFPGQTYQLTLKINRGSSPLIGMQLTALRTLDNKAMSNFTITDSINTWLQGGIFAQKDRYYVTHTFFGVKAKSHGYNEWTFDWTAPEQGEGDITFYWANNLSNGNGNEFGDTILLGKREIGDAPTVGISSDISAAPAIRYADGCLILQDAEQITNLTISTIDGKLLRRFSGPGPADNRFSIRLSQGIYIVHVSTRMGDKAQKLYVQ